MKARVSICNYTCLWTAVTILCAKGELGLCDNQIVIKYGEEPYKVTLQASKIGGDLLISLLGGDEPHIGAVAVSVPHPSLSDPDKLSASTSVYCFLEHKEDDLARKYAGRIAKRLNTKTVVTAGIHVSNITSPGIEKVVNNCEILIEQFLESFVNANDL